MFKKVLQRALVEKGTVEADKQSLELKLKCFIIRVIIMLANDGLRLLVWPILLRVFLQKFVRDLKWH